MSEIKIGDIVRMKLAVGWVENVRQYLNTPLLVVGPNDTCDAGLTLALLDGTVLLNPGSHNAAQAWSFDPKNLEHDEFLMAVRRRRHAQTR